MHLLLQLLVTSGALPHFQGFEGMCFLKLGQALSKKEEPAVCRSVLPKLRQAVCVFWDENLAAWSTEGVERVPSDTSKLGSKRAAGAKC